MSLRFIELSGQRFGRWLVLKHVENIGRNAAFLCKCDCGKEKVIPAFPLKNGNSRSCGCLRKEINAESMKKTMTIHGFTKGKGRPALYHVWEMMHYRCRNKEKYTAYKDVIVCQEWNDYQVFHNWAIASGYKKDLTIDRINPFGNYEPSNCRWITLKEQSRNRRYHLLVTVDGVTKNTWDWEAETGIPKSLIAARINSGWEHKRAVTEPVHEKTKIL